MMVADFGRTNPHQVCATRWSEAPEMGISFFAFTCGGSIVPGANRRCALSTYQSMIRKISHLRSVTTLGVRSR